MIHLRSLILAAAGLCAVHAFAADPSSDWKISGPFGGTATAIAVDPQNPKTLLAGGLDTLLFESQDAGASWMPLPFPRTNLGEVTSILVDPSDPNHYLVGVLDAFGGALYESHDAGKTWSANPAIHDFAVRALAASPSKSTEFVAGTVKGVLMSEDSGKTWTRISDPNNLEMIGITSIAIDPKDPQTIYAGTSHLPWKTTDGGKTWQSIHSGMIDDSDVFSIYVDPQQPSDVFASACSGIYASTNRGDEWRKIAGIPNTSRRTHVIRIDPTQSSVVYAGTTAGLYKSVNGGTTWRTLTNNQVNSIAFDPSSPKTMYFAMLNAGVGKSDDGGQTIHMINNGFVDRPITALTASGSDLVAIESQDGDTTGVFESADHGDTWTQRDAVRGLANVHLHAIAGALSDRKILLASTANQLYRTADGGAIWKVISLRVVTQPAEPKAPPVVRRKGHPAPVRRVVHPKPIIRDLTPSQIYSVFSFRDEGKDVFLVSTNLGMFRSNDFGQQWTHVEWNGTVTATGLYAPADADGHLVLRTSDGLFVSTDCGEHWARLNFPLPASDVNDVALTGGASNRMIVATRVGLYVSSDAGANWTLAASGIQPSTVSAVAFSPGTGAKAYAVEYGRLFQSTDGAKTWTSTDSGLHRLQIRQLWIAANSPDKLFGVTAAMGLLFRAY